MHKFLVAAASAAFLAACGGGGGNTFQTPEPDVRTLTGSQAPLETAASMTARSASRISRSDSLIISTIYGETSHVDVPTFRLTSNCSGTRCRLRNDELGINRVVGINDFSYVNAADKIALSKHGITLFGSESALGKHYGSWMQHSGFGVNSINLSLNGISETQRQGIAAGDLTGYHPRTSASWQGVMVGTPATGSERGDFLQGDARLVYNFYDASLDANFTGIKNIDKNRNHVVSSIRFDDVPMYTNGTFKAGLTGNRIQGGLYGPGHAEAAGVFEQSNVVGAFGAKKQ